MAEPTIVGRSSSHYTRTARMVALELDVAHAFQPLYDLMSLDPESYAGNPALKIPVLVDESGALFGTDNICRALARRSSRRDVVLRGDVDDRLVANAEELTVHVMSSEVTLIVTKMAGLTAPAKMVRSVENSLGWLDENVEALQARLPAERRTSFVEIALFCTLTHLPWREVMPVERWSRLGELVRRFGERASARSTEYRFDPPPAH